MKFIRKNGKVIPLREKKDGNVDKRHVSKNMLAEKASKMKPNKKGQAIGGVAGGLAGGYFGLKKGNLVTGMVGLALGSIAGQLVGGTRIISKQEAANKLKGKRVRKKNNPYSGVESEMKSAKWPDKHKKSFMKQIKKRKDMDELDQVDAMMSYERKHKIGSKGF